MAGGADELREPSRGVTQAAADVEHTVALTWRAGRERAFPVFAQALRDDVPVLNPDVEERAVPGLGRLYVVLDDPDRVVHFAQSRFAPWRFGATM
jgi:hypothetical protein